MAQAYTYGNRVKEGWIPPGTTALGSMPVPQAQPQAGGNGGWPGGYVSPTVGASGPPAATASQNPLVSQTAGQGVTAGAMSPPKINWNLPHLQQLLQQLGLTKQAQQTQQPGWDFNSLGLGNFYSPHEMGDVQNQQPYANSTIGMGGGYMPRQKQSVGRYK